MSVEEQLAEIRAMLREVQRQIAAPKEAPPAWETIAYAMQSRHRSRATLLEAVKAGDLTCRRESTHGGHSAYLLLVTDLDRNFPRRTTKKATA